MGGHQRAAAHDDWHVQHDESELDDRLARHAARGLGRGIQPSDGDVADRADADEHCGTTIRCAPGTTCVIRAGTITSAGFPAGRFHFNGFLHAGDERRRDRTIARSPGRSSCWACRPPRPAPSPRRARRRASSRSRRRASSRRRRRRCSCRTTGASSQRLTLNLGVRLEINGGMSEVEQSQPGRVRHHERQPDRGRGEGGVRAQSRFPQVPVAEFDVKGGLLFADGPDQRDQDQVAARAAASYLLTQEDGAARRRGPVLVRLLLREHQPGRLLAGHAGDRHATTTA